VPQAAEIPADAIAGHIRQALADADKAGILAKDVTPFLLARVLELTGGASLKTNIALIRSNAALAGQIAAALARSDA
jgi:pseudouridylate synthase